MEFLTGVLCGIRPSYKAVFFLMNAKKSCEISPSYIFAGIIVVCDIIFILLSVFYYEYSSNEEFNNLKYPEDTKDEGTELLDKEATKNEIE